MSIDIFSIKEKEHSFHDYLINQPNFCWQHVLPACKARSLCCQYLCVSILQMISCGVEVHCRLLVQRVRSCVKMAFVGSTVTMSNGGVSEATTSAKCAPHRQLLNLLCGAAVASMLSTAPVIAAPKLPPIDYTVRDRCKPVSSNVGQANAARDSLLDLRECRLPKLDFHGDLSGALLADSDMSDSDLEGVQLSKAFAQGMKLSRSNLTNAVLDRCVHIPRYPLCSLTLYHQIHIPQS